MNFGEPIRSHKKISQIKNLLRGQNRYRDLLLFVLGINAALRISDLLRLRIGHFVDENKQLRRRFWIQEQKRGKRQEVVVNNSIREALEEFLIAYPGVVDDPQNIVFFNSKFKDHSQPIKRGQAWKFMSTICVEVGLRGNYGTHSLRKTWGYHARMQGVDLALIMFKLNHNSIAYTKRYLGITNDELQAISQRLNL